MADTKYTASKAVDMAFDKLGDVRGKEIRDGFLEDGRELVRMSWTSGGRLRAITFVGMVTEAAIASAVSDAMSDGETE